MDLRKEFDDLIKKYGSKYIHIVQDHDKRCECFNTRYETAKDDCLVCLGTGNPVKIETINGRSQIAGSPLSIPMSNQSAKPAKLLSESKVFYLYHFVDIAEGDYMIMCEWDGDKPIFKRNTQICLINDAVPSYGDHGRVEYIRAWGVNDPLNAKIKLSNLEKRLKNKK